MKFLIVAGFIFVTGCSSDHKPSLSETAYRFIDAFFIHPDYNYAETLTDSLAKLKIKNHVSFHAPAQGDTVNRDVTAVSGFTLCDSVLGDSSAVYEFSLHVSDHDVFPSTPTTGFVRLSRFKREDWIVLDFGYSNQTGFR